jgi:hypothetical protein
MLVGDVSPDINEDLKDGRFTREHTYYNYGPDCTRSTCCFCGTDSDT